MKVKLFITGLVSKLPERRGIPYEWHGSYIRRPNTIKGARDTAREYDSAIVTIKLFDERMRAVSPF